jgi:predicted metal-dependent HD superfamily phosphohydrolase
MGAAMVLQGTSVNPAPWPVELQKKFNTLYSEPHRHYHTLVHVQDLLTKFEQYKFLVEAHEEIEAAIWFHDALYDPTRYDNEERLMLTSSFFWTSIYLF